MAEAAPTSPTVSILIAAYGAEQTISRAIRSALDQSLDIEVIVIDDASTDRTAEIADDHAASDPRVRVLRQEQNTGPAAARNHGLDVARAPWITVLDADDFYSDRNRLADLVGIARSEGADFVADDLWKVVEADPNGGRSRMLGDEEIGLQWLDAAAFIAGNCSVQNGGRRELGFLKPIMSREALDRFGLRYDDDIRLGEDYVLYARAIISGAQFLLTDPRGYVAVVRRRSLSGKHPTEAHERLIVADRALLDLPGVDSRTRAQLRAHLDEQQKKWAWRRLLDAKSAGDPMAALACFKAPPGVVFDLLIRLWGEARSRIAAQLRFGTHENANKTQGSER